MDVAVDGRGEQQLGGVRSVDFQCFVQIAPFVTRGVGRMDARAASSLDSADHRQQSVAMFVEHPEAHRLGWSKTNDLI